MHRSPNKILVDLANRPKWLHWLYSARASRGGLPWAAEDVGHNATWKVRASQSKAVRQRLSIQGCTPRTVWLRVLRSPTRKIKNRACFPGCPRRTHGPAVCSPFNPGVRSGRRPNRTKVSRTPRIKSLCGTSGICEERSHAVRPCWTGPHHPYRTKASRERTQPNAIVHTSQLVPAVEPVYS